MTRYLLGLGAGILAGLIFALSAVLQKRAVNAVDPAGPLMRQVVRDPVWLLALVLAFVAAPLNMVAYVLIGPTLVPALGTLSLVAIPLLARVILREKMGRNGYLGSGCVVVGVLCMGFSGLTIPSEALHWQELPFLIRAVVSCVIIALFIGAAILAARFAPARAFWTFAMAAGSAQVLNNLLMTPIASQLGALVTGRFGLSELAIAGAASIGLIGINVLSISLDQHALKHGDVARVVPVKQIPIQIAPLILHIWLYQQPFGMATGLWAIGGLIALCLGVRLIHVQDPVRSINGETVA